MGSPGQAYTAEGSNCSRWSSGNLYAAGGTLANGRVIPDTEQFYQIAVIGSGKLLPQFEKGLLGVKSGSVVQFDVTFPETYGNQALAGCTVAFLVYLHKVMEPVFYHDIREMKNKPVRNVYRFDDLKGLKKI